MVIKIKFIGLKKGEKLVEELLTKGEKNNLMKTKMEDIHCLKNFDKCNIDIDNAISKLESLASKGRKNELLSFIKDIFPSLESKVKDK